MENTLTHEDRIRYAAGRLEDILEIYDKEIPQSIRFAMQLAIERIRQLENDIEFLQSSW